MQILEQAHYQQLIQNSVIIEEDHKGPKVIQLSDKRLLKLFRIKPWINFQKGEPLFSSAAWRPYAKRFMQNTQILQQKGIAVPSVDAHFHIPHLQRDAIIYRPLPGISVRLWLEQSPTADDTAIANLRIRLKALIEQLHQSGIYFRALHPGNIIIVDNDTLGLIDLVDTKFFRTSLRPYYRRRNLLQLYHHCSEKEKALFNFISPDDSK